MSSAETAANPEFKLSTSLGTFLLPAFMASFLPYLGFAVQNAREEIAWSSIVLYASATAIVFGLLPLLALPFGRRAAGRVSFALSFFVLAIFNFALLKEYTGYRDMELLWVHAAILVAAIVVGWLLSRFEISWRIWFAALLAMIVASVGQYFLVYSGTSSTAPTSASGTDTQKALPAAAIPTKMANAHNVYFLIPDAYGRADELKSVLNFDNTEFINFLERNKFQVGMKSHSNYVATALSVSSMLEMDYVVDETTADVWSLNPYYRDVLNGKNNAFKAFQDRGYYVAKLNWINTCTQDGYVDFCYGNDRNLMRVNMRLTELEFSLLRMTALHDLAIEHFPKLFYRHLGDKDFSNVLDMIRFVREERPTLYFGHVLLPHPPYRFNSKCGPAEQLDTAYHEGAWTERGKGLYVDATKCANLQLRQIIGEINQHDPDAIVVISSDHGAAFSVSWTIPYADWTNEQVEERFGNFVAARLPEECKSTFYDEISPVNLFEMILACVDGRKPAFKDDRIYITTFFKSHPDYGKLWRYK